MDFFLPLGLLLLPLRKMEKGAVVTTRGDSAVIQTLKRDFHVFTLASIICQHPHLTMTYFVKTLINQHPAEVLHGAHVAGATTRVSDFSCESLSSVELKHFLHMIR